jgi:hypothetical protein
MDVLSSTNVPSSSISTNVKKDYQTLFWVPMLFQARLDQIFQ